MKPLTCTLAILLLAAGCGGSEPVDNTALRARLAYLENLSEVDWVDYEGGQVFIGFNQRNAELPAVVNTAAAVGHKAHTKRVHVFAVQGAAPGWRPGDGPVYCEAELHLGTVVEICN